MGKGLASILNFPEPELRSWKISNSEDLYRVSEWGAGYFGINESGHVTVQSNTLEADGLIDLKQVVDRLKEEKNLSPPFVIRFPEILRSRMSSLVHAFRTAIDSERYDGSYQGCFPVKVNQQREVFEEVTNFSEDGGIGFGLEVGTKSELLAALAETKNRNAPLICNGYKDAELVDLALYGKKSGINVIIVLERVEELDLILDRAERIGVRPNLGVRIRVSSEGVGKWASTAGGKGLFGLNACEIIGVVDKLEAVDKLDCLSMLHYHQGSQIPDIKAIKRGITEVIKIYGQLLSEGVSLTTINVGGGLAIDYDGSAIVGPMSMNYSLQEYADTIVATLREFADERNIAHPNIISESGRAITSHFSVFVFEVLRSERFSDDVLIDRRSETDCAPLLQLRKLMENFPTEIPFVTGTLASKLLVECNDEFGEGNISFRELAEAQRLQLTIFGKIVSETSSKWVDARQLLNSPQYAQYYYGNFSLFQSMPDSWAIDQVFPVMPIHRLNEKPAHSGIVADITCDSDGKIKHYADRWDEMASVPLHQLKEDEPYYLGAFLVGAYQETLGDFHNLLGRPTVVTVREQEAGSPQLELIPGDTASWILEHVHFDSVELRQKIERLSRQAEEEGRMTSDEKQKFTEVYEHSLNGSSYLSYQ